MRRKYFTQILYSLIIFIAAFSVSNAQWKQLNSDTKVNLTGVAVIDSSTAIVTGEAGTILKTTDSGNTWEKINLNIINNLNAISCRTEFYSSGNSIIIAGDKILLISPDSGKTWSIKNEPYNFTTVDQGFTTPLLYAFSPDSAVILGTDKGRILFSTDEGNTWMDTLLFNSGIIAANFDVYTTFGYGTGSKVFAASASNYVSGDIVNKKWSKYGIGNYIPWQNITSGDLAYDYEFLVGDGGELISTALLLRKRQSDTAWTNISQNMPVGIYPNEIKNFRYAVFICGRLGEILKSTDNGDSWIDLKSPVNTALNDIAFYNQDIGYAVGDSGTILYTNNGGITAVKEKHKIIPAEFKLYQNYPNPFNPNTKIKYNIPEAGFVQLTVYNNIGQKVKMLVNSNMSAGNHSVNFNAADLPSGVYFYEIRFGNASVAKKMLLIK